MSEEEKKEIEMSKVTLKVAKDNNMSNMFYDVSSLETILNLIEKQQEEIKELKEITKAYNSFEGSMNGETKIIIGDSRYFNNGTFVRQYISKDKIRDKIKELEEKKKHQDNMGLRYSEVGLFQGKIDILEEIIDEYNNEEIKSLSKLDYISKDKIRNFFEERLLKYTEADDGIYDKPYLTRGELELVDRYGECKEIAKILLAEKIEIPKESISKDKIRDKIKELEKEEHKNKFTEKDKKRLAKIEVLNELLEEE